MFDTLIVIGYVMVFAFERGLPVQQILYIDLAAACVRFAILGGLILAAISAPIVAVFEKLRVKHLETPFSWKLVAFQTGLEVLMALIVGWLVSRLAAENAGSRRGPTRRSACTRPSARRWRSCGGSRRFGSTSSRSSPTRCARRWPR